ncbi:MAG TPA: hypothetical protein VE439_09755 [Anaerolineae bacterium]|nr:hypothetical protein [Anaerolineae bacterium]
MYTLGIDLHKEFALWALLVPEGTTLWQKKIATPQTQNSEPL